VVPLSKKALAAVVVGCLSVAVVASACGSPHTTKSYPGGNNAPTTKPVPSKSTTTTPHTTVPTTAPSSVSTTAPSTTTTTTTVPPITAVTGPTHVTPDTPHNMDKKGTPEWVAAQYERLAGSLAFTWPDPTAWVEQAKPYMSPTYWATMRAKQFQPPTPAESQYWDQVVTDQEGYWVDVISSDIAENAPKTPTSCYVTVDYMTGRVLPKGTHEPPNGTPVADAYPMAKIGGTWYVNGPGFPSPGT